MSLKLILALSGLPAVLGSPCGMDYTKNGLVWGDAIRMNQIQVVGTHNSYHVEAPQEEKALLEEVSPDVEDLWYSHDQLGVQLTEQHVRNLELDILADPEGGNYARPLVRKLSNLPYNTGPEYNTSLIKVMHIPDLDIHTVCTTLTACLKTVKAFVDAHPKAVPISIITEFKESESLGQQLGGAKIIPWGDAKLLDSLDDEIRSVFGPKQLITPDDIRRPGLTLEQSVLQHGWPNLDSARGRVMFLMDNGPNEPVNKVYLDGKPNLEGRVLFTNSAPGKADCAFQKLNDVVTDSYVANIQKQVGANYYVRTMADVPLGNVRNCTTSQRDMAFRSGAQVVSSDFPVPGLSDRYGGCKYVVELGDGKVARCNPVNGRKGCVDTALE